SCPSAVLVIFSAAVTLLCGGWTGAGDPFSPVIWLAGATLLFFPVLILIGRMMHKSIWAIAKDWGRNIWKGLSIGSKPYLKIYLVILGSLALVAYLYLFHFDLYWAALKGCKDFAEYHYISMKIISVLSGTLVWGGLVEIISQLNMGRKVRLSAVLFKMLVFGVYGIIALGYLYLMDKFIPVIWSGFLVKIIIDQLGYSVFIFWPEYTTVVNKFYARQGQEEVLPAFGAQWNEKVYRNLLEVWSAWPLAHLVTFIVFQGNPVFQLIFMTVFGFCFFLVNSNANKARQHKQDQTAEFLHTLTYEYQSSREEQRDGHTSLVAIEEKDRHRLLVIGETDPRFPRIAHGAFNDIFDLGTYVLRFCLCDYYPADSAATREEKAFSRLGALGISPNFLFTGKTGNACDCVAVEKIVGRSINNYGDPLSDVEIGYIRDLLALLIQNNILVTAFKPSNFMIGHKVGETEVRAYLVDAGATFEEPDPYKLSVGYYEGYVYHQSEWKQHDPEGEILKYLEANVKTRKQALRQQMYAKRRLQTTQEREQRSQSIWKKLCSLEQFQEAGTVGFFNSLGQEVDTAFMIEGALSAGKHVALPRCRDREGNLDFYEFKAGDTLVPSKFYPGLLEPMETAVLVSEREIDVLIVSGLAFDSRGNHLGHGVGYYDRYMSRPEFRATKIALAFSFQLMSQVPVTKSDVKVDFIISEDGIREIPTSSVRPRVRKFLKLARLNELSSRSKALNGLRELGPQIIPHLQERYRESDANENERSVIMDTLEAFAWDTCIIIDIQRNIGMSRAKDAVSALNLAEDLKYSAKLNRPIIPIDRIICLTEAEEEAIGLVQTAKETDIDGVAIYDVNRIRPTTNLKLLRTDNPHACVGAADACLATANSVCDICTLPEQERKPGGRGRKFGQVQAKYAVWLKERSCHVVPETIEEICQICGISFERRGHVSFLAKRFHVVTGGLLESKLRARNCIFRGIPKERSDLQGAITVLIQGIITDPVRIWNNLRLFPKTKGDAIAFNGEVIELLVQEFGAPAAERICRQIFLTDPVDSQGEQVFHYSPIPNLSGYTLWSIRGNAHAWAGAAESLTHNEQVWVVLRRILLYLGKDVGGQSAAEIARDLDQRGLNVSEERVKEVLHGRGFYEDVTPTKVAELEDPIKKKMRKLEQDILPFRKVFLEQLVCHKPQADSQSGGAVNYPAALGPELHSKYAGFKDISVKAVFHKGQVSVEAQNGTSLKPNQAQALKHWLEEMIAKYPHAPPCDEYTVVDIDITPNTSTIDIAGVGPLHIISQYLDKLHLIQLHPILLESEEDLAEALELPKETTSKFAVTCICDEFGHVSGFDQDLGDKKTLEWLALNPEYLLANIEVFRHSGKQGIYPDSDWYKQLREASRLLMKIRAKHRLVIKELVKQANRDIRTVQIILDGAPQASLMTYGDLEEAILELSGLIDTNGDSLDSLQEQYLVSRRLFEDAKEHIERISRRRKPSANKELNRRDQTFSRVLAQTRSEITSTRSGAIKSLKSMPASIVLDLQARLRLLNTLIESQAADINCNRNERGAILEVLAYFVSRTCIVQDAHEYASATQAQKIVSEINVLEELDYYPGLDRAIIPADKIQLSDDPGTDRKLALATPLVKVAQANGWIIYDVNRKTKTPDTNLFEARKNPNAWVGASFTVEKRQRLYEALLELAPGDKLDPETRRHIEQTHDVAGGTLVTIFRAAGGKWGREPIIVTSNMLAVIRRWSEAQSEQVKGMPVIDIEPNAGVGSILAKGIENIKQEILRQAKPRDSRKTARLLFDVSAYTGRFGLTEKNIQEIFEGGVENLVFEAMDESRRQYILLNNICFDRRAMSITRRMGHQLTLADIGRCFSGLQKEIVIVDGKERVVMPFLAALRIITAPTFAVRGIVADDFKAKIVARLPDGRKVWDVATNDEAWGGYTSVSALLGEGEDNIAEHDLVGALPGFKKSSLPSRIKAAAVDLEGTLLDTEIQINREVFADKLYCEVIGLERIEANLEAGRKYYDEFLVGVKEEEVMGDLLRRRDPFAGEPLSAAQYLHNFEDALIKEQDMTLKLYPQCLRIPGAIRLLKDLHKQGVRLFLVTSTPSITVEKMQKVFPDLFKYFTGFIYVNGSSEKVEAIQAIMESEFLKADQVMFVDDSPVVVEKVRKHFGDDILIISRSGSALGSKRLDIARADIISRNFRGMARTLACLDKKQGYRTEDGHWIYKIAISENTYFCVTKIGANIVELVIDGKRMVWHEGYSDTEHRVTRLTNENGTLKRGGIPFMFPWSSRIHNGIAEFTDESNNRHLIDVSDPALTLPRKDGLPPLVRKDGVNPLHGMADKVLWHLERAGNGWFGSKYVKLSYSTTEHEEISKPFGHLRVELIFKLSANRLDVSTKVTNQDKCTRIFSFGHHGWFLLSGLVEKLNGWFVQVPADKYWPVHQNDANAKQVPVYDDPQAVSKATETDFREPVSLDDRGIEVGLTDLRSRFGRMTSHFLCPSAGETWDISQSKEYQNAMLWVPKNFPGVASIQPTTSSANAINMYAKGHRQANPIIRKPGRSIRANWSITRKTTRRNYRSTRPVDRVPVIAAVNNKGIGDNINLRGAERAQWMSYGIEGRTWKMPVYYFARGSLEEYGGGALVQLEDGLAIIIEEGDEDALFHEIGEWYARVAKGNWDRDLAHEFATAFAQKGRELICKIEPGESITPEDMWGRIIASNSPTIVGDPANLKITAVCDWDKPAIEEMAKEITCDLTDDADKAEAIWDWIRHNIYYSMGYDGAYMDSPASETLSSRAGMCFNAANLFIAMCRSLGIPARYVYVIVPVHREISALIGFEWSEDEKAPNVAPHVFAEAFVGGQWRKFTIRFGLALKASCFRICAPDIGRVIRVYTNFSSHAEKDQLEDRRRLSMEKRYGPGKGEITIAELEEISQAGAPSDHSAPCALISSLRDDFGKFGETRWYRYLVGPALEEYGLFACIVLWALRAFGAFRSYSADFKKMDSFDDQMGYKMLILGYRSLPMLAGFIVAALYSLWVGLVTLIILKILAGSRFICVHDEESEISAPLLVASYTASSWGLLMVLAGLKYALDGLAIAAPLLFAFAIISGYLLTEYYPDSGYAAANFLLALYFASLGAAIFYAGMPWWLWFLPLIHCLFNPIEEARGCAPALVGRSKANQIPHHNRDMLSRRRRTQRGKHFRSSPSDPIRNDQPVVIRDAFGTLRARFNQALNQGSISGIEAVRSKIREMIAIGNLSPEQLGRLGTFEQEIAYALICLNESRRRPVNSSVSRHWLSNILAIILSLGALFISPGCRSIRPAEWPTLSNSTDVRRIIQPAEWPSLGKQPLPVVQADDSINIPAGYGLHAVGPLYTYRPTIIFVHSAEGRAEDFRYFVKELSMGQQCNIIVFSYDKDRPINLTANFFLTSLSNIREFEHFTNGIICVGNGYGVEVIAEAVRRDKPEAVQHERAEVFQKEHNILVQIDPRRTDKKSQEFAGAFSFSTVVLSTVGEPSPKGLERSAVPYRTQPASPKTALTDPDVLQMLIKLSQEHYGAAVDTSVPIGVNVAAGQDDADQWIIDQSVNPYTFMEYAAQMGAEVFNVSASRLGVEKYPLLVLKAKDKSQFERALGLASDRHLIGNGVLLAVNRKEGRPGHIENITTYVAVVVEEYEGDNKALFHEAGEYLGRMIAEKEHANAFANTLRQKLVSGAPTTIIYHECAEELVSQQKIEVVSAKKPDGSSALRVAFRDTVLSVIVKATQYDRDNSRASRQQPEIPDALERIYQKMTAESHRERYTAIQGLRAELRKIKDPQERMTRQVEALDHLIKRVSDDKEANAIRHFALKVITSFDGEFPVLELVQNDFIWLLELPSTTAQITSTLRLDILVALSEIRPTLSLKQELIDAVVNQFVLFNLESDIGAAKIVARALVNLIGVNTNERGEDCLLGIALTGCYTHEVPGDRGLVQCTTKSFDADAREEILVQCSELLKIRMLKLRKSQDILQNGRFFKKSCSVLFSILSDESEDAPEGLKLFAISLLEEAVCEYIDILNSNTSVWIEQGKITKQYAQSVTEPIANAAGRLLLDYEDARLDVDKAIKSGLSRIKARCTSDGNSLWQAVFDNDRELCRMAVRRIFELRDHSAIAKLHAIVRVDSGVTEIAGIIAEEEFRVDVAEVQPAGNNRIQPFGGINEDLFVETIYRSQLKFDEGQDCDMVIYGGQPSFYPRGKPAEALVNKLTQIWSFAESLLQTGPDRSKTLYEHYRQLKGNYTDRKVIIRVASGFPAGVRSGYFMQSDGTVEIILSKEFVDGLRIDQTLALFICIFHEMGHNRFNREAFCKEEEDLIRWDARLYQRLSHHPELSTLDVDGLYPEDKVYLDFLKSIKDKLSTKFELKMGEITEDKVKDVVSPMGSFIEKAPLSQDSNDWPVWVKINHDGECQIDISFAGIRKTLNFSVTFGRGRIAQIFNEELGLKQYGIEACGEESNLTVTFYMASSERVYRTIEIRIPERDSEFLSVEEIIRKELMKLVTEIEQAQAANARRSAVQIFVNYGGRIGAFFVYLWFGGKPVSLQFDLHSEDSLYWAIDDVFNRFSWIRVWGPREFDYSVKFCERPSMEEPFACFASIDLSALRTLGAQGDSQGQKRLIREALVEAYWRVSRRLPPPAEVKLKEPVTKLPPGKEHIDSPGEDLSVQQPVAQRPDKEHHTTTKKGSQAILDNNHLRPAALAKEILANNISSPQDLTGKFVRIKRWNIRRKLNRDGRAYKREGYRIRFGKFAADGRELFNLPYTYQAVGSRTRIHLTARVSLGKKTVYFEVSRTQEDNRLIEAYLRHRRNMRALKGARTEALSSAAKERLDAEIRNFLVSFKVKVPAIEALLNYSVVFEELGRGMNLPKEQVILANGDIIENVQSGACLDEKGVIHVYLRPEQFNKVATGKLS
ncbi:MAG: 5-formyltetrahydrofolate cyclo-ligase, partial [Candidatus Omnitrophica bacterium]|nr:5-formyltetrahydrofolate cyclo-ligase [Candidatus Omnitrophota bacterium]